LLSSFTDSGIRSDFNDEQSQSASDAIRVSFDPDSNVNDESDLHPQKDLSPRNSTEAGRQIDFNDEQLQSAHDAIRVSFDPDSNVNDESDLHPQKDF
jgi:hypothetical protein